VQAQIAMTAMLEGCEHERGRMFVGMDVNVAVTMNDAIA
jgi:hypothetical protein